MEPSATFGRGHKHSSSLLGPKPRSHPLPELATLAPTSPSFAGRGDVSGLFWNLVSGEEFHGDTPLRHFPGRILPLRWQKLTLDVEGSSRKI